MLTRIFVSAIALAILLSAPALAADGESTPLNIGSADQPATSQAAAAPGAGGGSIARAIFGLLVVVALIYGLTWVLKQIKASKEEKASGTGLHALATLPLGPNRSLHLIRAGRELVLVGVGEAGVTPIRTYSEHEAEQLGLFDGDALGSKPVVKPVVRAGSLVEQLRRRTVIK